MSIDIGAFELTVESNVILGTAGAERLKGTANPELIQGLGALSL